MTAIQATFSDFRLVKGRKVAQLIFEVPLEAANAALAALGGVPMPDKEVWVGIARLKEESSREPPEDDIEGDIAQDTISLVRRTSSPLPESKSRRKFDDLPLPQQAGIIAKEPSFWRFVEWRQGRSPMSVAEEESAKYIRRQVGVTSRSEIRSGTNFEPRWKMLLSAYEAWKVAG